MVDSIYRRILRRPDQDYRTFFLAVFPRAEGGAAAASEDRWLLSLITVVRNAKGSRAGRNPDETARRALSPSQPRDERTGCAKTRWNLSRENRSFRYPRDDSRHLRSRRVSFVLFLGNL